MATEKQETIEQAFIHAQTKFTPVVKDADNPYFKSNYATYKAIVEMIRPILAQHGLGFTQGYIRTSDGGEVIRTRIVHTSGAAIDCDVPIMWKDRTPQGNGSAITYARRYGLQAAFGVIVAEDESDDDGNRAQGIAKAAPHPAPPPKQQAAPAAVDPTVCPCGKSKGAKFDTLDDATLKAILDIAPAKAPAVTDAHREAIKAIIAKRKAAANEVKDI